MDRNMYLRISDKYEKLCIILDEISQLNCQTESCWKTDAGKLFTISLRETQMYIRKILDQFSSELHLTVTENTEVSDELNDFTF